MSQTRHPCPDLGSKDGGNDAITKEKKYRSSKELDQVLSVLSSEACVNGWENCCEHISLTFSVAFATGLSAGFHRHAYHQTTPHSKMRCADHV